jgi:L-asparaginase type II
MKNKLPSIAILSLGGTLAALAPTRVDEFYATSSLSIEELIANLPELNDIANISSEQMVQVPSQDLSGEIWLQLARRIQSLLATDFDGVVITQGTFTIEETAYFLNLVCRTEKPIILTGAMHPANALGSDGLRNLYNAVLLAGSPLAKNKGILLTFNDEICSAREVSKTQSDSFHGISKQALLGYIKGQTISFYAETSRKHTLQTEFDISLLENLPDVQIVYGSVGCNPKIIDSLIEMSTAGIISAGMGYGYQSSAVTQALIVARKKGVIIVRCARSGNLLVSRFPTVDDKCDFISGNNLTPQKARILLSLALTRTQNTQEIQGFFDVY